MRNILKVMVKMAVIIKWVTVRLCEALERLIIQSSIKMAQQAP